MAAETEIRLDPESLRVKVGVLSVSLDALGFGEIKLNGKHLVCKSFRVSCYQGQPPTVTVILDTDQRRYP